MLKTDHRIGTRVHFFIIALSFLTVISGAWADEETTASPPIRRALSKLPPTHCSGFLEVKSRAVKSEWHPEFLYYVVRADIETPLKFKGLIAPLVHPDDVQIMARMLYPDRVLILKIRSDFVPDLKSVPNPDFTCGVYYGSFNLDAIVQTRVMDWGPIQGLSGLPENVSSAVYQRVMPSLRWELYPSAQAYDFKNAFKNVL